MSTRPSPSSSSEPDVRVELITPTKAREYLARNTHNRNLRARVVAAYANDMRTGHWRWNGESIKFSFDGVLLDGQHRLAAVVEADAPVRMLVIRGLPDITQETMDGGTKRRFSDVLTLRGEGHANTLAAACRRIVQWESGSKGPGANYTPTNAQMLQVLERYPWLRDGAKVAQRVARGADLPASILAFTWWLFVQIDADDAEFFFDRLGDGQNLVEDDPIYVLRKVAHDSRTVRGERSEKYLLAVTIKAWNAYREGRQVKLLRYRPGGATPEAFPEPC